MELRVKGNSLGDFSLKEILIFFPGINYLIGLPYQGSGSLRSDNLPGKFIQPIRGNEMDNMTT